MGVGVVRVILMNREVRHHPLSHEVGADIVAYELNVLAVGQFDG
jgi:hypothetical protein